MCLKHLCGPIFLRKQVPQTKHIGCCRKIGLTMPNYSSKDNNYEENNIQLKGGAWKYSN